LERIPGMSDLHEDGNAKQSVPLVTMAAAVLVLILAVAAAFFPNSARYEMHEVFLVYDAPGVDEGRDDFFQSLAGVLGEISAHPMKLVVASNRDDFLRLAADGADFVFCPDGLAMSLDPALYYPLATGRRKIPRNLRPCGVTVFRKTVGFEERPWESSPRRTVFGDSLSLVAIGGGGASLDVNFCAFGPDPYDHGPVLQALRLGAFDYALVRQWDADDFFSAGLLDTAIWGSRKRTDPLPDIVVMVSKEVPLVDRAKWADTLALVGRSGQSSLESSEMLSNHFDKLGLAGFNILLEPDFELVRRNFSQKWPVTTD